MQYITSSNKFKPASVGQVQSWYELALQNKCIYRKKHPYDCFTNLSIPMTAFVVSSIQ